MSSLDFLYYALGGGFLVLVGFLSVTLYHLIKLIKSTKSVVDDIEDTTNDVSMIKNSVKSGLASILDIVIDSLKKRGGGKNGR